MMCLLADGGLGGGSASAELRSQAHHHGDDARVSGGGWLLVPRMTGRSIGGDMPGVNGPQGARVMYAAQLLQAHCSVIVVPLAHLVSGERSAGQGAPHKETA